MGGSVDPAGDFNLPTQVPNLLDLYRPDVESAAGDHFDRRPSEAMPGKVEDRHRYAAIDPRGAGEVGRRTEAIFPRARKQRELERAGRASGRIFGEQGARQLVCVLANAAALAQRGTIVDQDAHLCKSFRVSILL